MQTDSHSDIELIKIGAGILFTGIMGLFGWLGNRHINRLDKIEREYVSKSSLSAEIKKIETKIDDGTKGTHARLDKLMMFLASHNKQGD